MQEEEEEEAKRVGRLSMKMLPKFLSLWHISVCLSACVCVSACGVHLCVFDEENDYRFAMHIFRLPCCTLAHLTFPFDLFACFALDIGKAQPLSRPDSLSFCRSVCLPLCLSDSLSDCQAVCLSPLLSAAVTAHVVPAKLYFNSFRFNLLAFP